MVGGKYDSKQTIKKSNRLILDQFEIKLNGTELSPLLAVHFGIKSFYLLLQLEVKPILFEII